LRPRQFFKIWTRKEAEAKLSGEGLAALEAAPFAEKPLQSTCEELPVAGDYAAHLALSEARLQVKLLHWSPDWQESSATAYNPSR
jgi:phosphopantetheinyl transferase